MGLPTLWWDGLHVPEALSAMSAGVLDSHQAEQIER